MGKIKNRGRGYEGEKGLLNTTRNNFQIYLGGGEQGDSLQKTGKQQQQKIDLASERQQFLHKKRETGEEKRKETRLVETEKREG